MEIKGSLGTYTLGKQVAHTEHYRTYLCIQQNPEPRQCLLQIATDVQFNGKLDRAAFFLRELTAHAAELERGFESKRARPDQRLNYQLGFPELVESFIFAEQGLRRVNILAFRSVDDISTLVPLINLTVKDRVRVDLRTSVWIQGKLLKMIDFAHSKLISVNDTLGKNVLIEPRRHYVLIFDWVEAEAHEDSIPIDARKKDITEGAQGVITALGGDPETDFIPDDGDEEGFARYTKQLLDMSHGLESIARRAYDRFYQLVDSIWTPGFHPFTTKPL